MESHSNHSSACLCSTHFEVSAAGGPSLAHHQCSRTRIRGFSVWTHRPLSAWVLFIRANAKGMRDELVEADESARGVRFVRNLFDSCFRYAVDTCSQSFNQHLFECLFVFPSLVLRPPAALALGGWITHVVRSLHNPCSITLLHSRTQTVKALAGRWKALSDAERAPFEAEAAALKEQYKKDVAAWRAAPPPESSECSRDGMLFCAGLTVLCHRWLWRLRRLWLRFESCRSVGASLLCLTP